MLLSTNIDVCDEQLYNFCKELLNADNKIQYVQQTLDITFDNDAIITSLLGGNNQNITDDDEINLEYLLFISAIKLKAHKIEIHPIQENVDINDKVQGLKCSLRTFCSICSNNIDRVIFLSDDINLVYFLDICLSKVFECSSNMHGLIRRRMIFQRIVDKTKTQRNLPWCNKDRLVYQNHELCKTFDNDEYEVLSLKLETELYEYGNTVCNNFKSFKRVENKKIYMIFDPELLDGDDVIDYDHTYISDVLNVLCIMRDKKIYHGDLKANNLLINPHTKEIQIIDLESGRKVSKTNKITDDDMVMGYYDWDSENPDATANLCVYLSDRVLYLYDIYKFAASIYRSDLWDKILPIMHHVSNELYLDFLVLLFQFKENNYGHKFVTTIHQLKRDIVLKVPDFLIEHRDKLIDVMKEIN